MLKRQRLIQRIGKMNEWRCWFLSYWINLSSDTNNCADSLFINDMISPLIDCHQTDAQMQQTRYLDII